MKKSKRKMGRPSLGKDARNLGVLVRVSANELAAWRIAANAAGLTLSSWIAEPRRDETERQRRTIQYLKP